jgi:hypothetical protein
MQKHSLLIPLLIVLIAGGIVGYIVGAKKSSGHAHQSAMIEHKELALYNNMRKLWADHVIWTREYIIGAVDGTADVNEAANRLMKNQEDIGNAIKPYYGSEAGDKLTSLLKEHISIAVELVDAAKTGQNEKFANANERWNKNASDIAKFLSSANQAWPEDTLVEMMNMHLKTTTDEAIARLKKDYPADVKAFDTVFEHMMGMSDALSAGIIEQFPEKF